MLNKVTALLIVTFLLTSVVGSSQPVDCPDREFDCPGDPERNILSFQEVQSYIKLYRNHFQGNWKTHTRALYLNAETIIFLNRFFASNPRYLGVNIHFNVHKKIDATGQVDANQFLFYFTPTHDLHKPSLTYKVSDYLAFKNFHDSMWDRANFPIAKINYGSICPNFCDLTTSTAAWGKPVTYARLNIIGGGNGLLFNSDPSIEVGYKKNYRKQAGYNKQKHTRSTFIKAETIKLLADFLANRLSTYPAVAMYTLSYGKKMPQIPGSKWPFQIGVAFAPMIVCEGNYEPDFCGFAQFVQMELKALKALKTFNHGELCPDDCPKDPDETGL